ncbi:hypothetical protein OSTOST_10128, partial [Ostertagia ostertagi]
MHIRNLRNQLGLKRTTTKYCHAIRDQNEAIRLDFCREMIKKGATFSNYVFTDECTVQRFCELVRDNAPPHTSRYTASKLKEWNVETVSWPPESPDLNPIEIVWGTMKNFVRSLTPDVCANFIRGLPSKMERQKGRNIDERRSRKKLPNISKNTWKINQFVVEMQRCQRAIEWESLQLLRVWYLAPFIVHQKAIEFVNKLWSSRKRRWNEDALIVYDP